MARQDLLKVWETDLRICCHGHYEAAVRFDRLHYWIGIPIVTLSGGAGTAVSVSLVPYKPIFGFVSLTVAVLGALQTFLRLSERAERHREAGARYGALLKELEQYKITVMNDQEFKNWADGFRRRWDELSVEVFTIPGAIYRRHHFAKWKQHNEKKQPPKNPS